MRPLYTYNMCIFIGYSKFAVLASVCRLHAHRSIRRAPRGGNCWTENTQPCPTSVLPITDAEVDFRSKSVRRLMPHPFLPTRCHAILRLAPVQLYPSKLSDSCFLLVDPSPSPIVPLGKPTHRPPPLFEEGSSARISGNSA